ncbi:DUF4145 domain-containing protein [Paenacidovorax monticola]|uniref:DUF4145 domain-containing protein n=1 Tax=Paenacidovorax monticola TaxID=1926868 RepID=A0A7H0HG33_9BURK|nr:DUF4145 domain-containing protein [Paenacidovorax monticola]QNP59499.1 DUF4145 domain-containing protein [Paenacidovorax monticola]
MNEDFENIIETFDGDYGHKTVVLIYPSVIQDHKPLEDTFYIPKLIRKIYNQTLNTLSSGAYVLASIGLRATIEATCNHLLISGATLEKRIDQLVKSGHVSNSDRKLLHAIRFLGNDAAHNITEPKHAEIRVALDIVEHILNTLFVLPKKARSLDTVVENYADFIKLVEACAAKSPASTTKSLIGLLDSKRRLIPQVSIDEYEKQLLEEISAGNVPFLSLVEAANVEGKDVNIYQVLDDPANDPF